jgi:hypothetical protein
MRPPRSFTAGCQEFVAAPELGRFLGVIDRHVTEDGGHVLLLTESAVLEPVQRGLVDASVDATARVVRGVREEEEDLQFGGEVEQHLHQSGQEFSIVGLRGGAVDTSLPDSEGMSEHSVSGVGNNVCVLRDGFQPPNDFVGREALGIRGPFQTSRSSASRTNVRMMGSLEKREERQSHKKSPKSAAVGRDAQPRDIYCRIRRPRFWPIPRAVNPL